MFNRQRKALSHTGVNVSQNDSFGFLQAYVVLFQSVAVLQAMRKNLCFPMYLGIARQLVYYHQASIYCAHNFMGLSNGIDVLHYRYCRMISAVVAYFLSKRELGDYQCLS